jgi:hypothetical protein
MRKRFFDIASLIARLLPLLMVAHDSGPIVFSQLGGVLPGITCRDGRSSR